MRCKWTIFTIILFRLGVQEVHSQWSWDKIPKWTDVYLRKDGFYNLEFKLEFLMDNYDVISLEKCLYEDHNDKNTEAHFIDLTSKMRSLRPSSDTKILFYWHLTQIINDCYQSTQEFMDRPDLWLYDSSGEAILNKGHHVLDFRVAEARTMWANVPVNVLASTEGGANGVFIDGCHFTQLTGLSDQELQDFNSGLVLAVGELKEKLSASDIVIGNGLMNYDFLHGLGNPTYDIFVDVVDGFCMEHVMAFEGVNMNAQHQPFIKIDALENLIELRNLLVSKNKYLLSRSYPGPVGQPIDSSGEGYSGPSLPAHYNYPEPSTNLEVQQAMRDLYKFPLAVYLCAFADTSGKVMYTYSTWYNIGQSVPCPDDPESCQFPDNFDDYLGLSPGAPAGEPTWDGTVCSRQYEKLSVTVDIADDASATINVF